MTSPIPRLRNGSQTLKEGRSATVRILWIDIDTLRADHLGCYGYHRNTSPTIDWIAKEGVVFTNCFVSDAPCLPSRAALIMGRFGIHNGVVGHGGTAADPFPIGRDRPFASHPDFLFLFQVLKRMGYRTVSVSPFPERHAAWWFCGGLTEWFNPGKGGMEIADDVTPLAVKWLEENAEEENWLLHVNYWDPHTPYRTPLDFGNPFESDPPPSWLTEEILQRHREGYGPYSARDVLTFAKMGDWPRLPKEIATLDDWKRWIDGYDTGIRYADEHVKRLLDVLDKKGVLYETVIIVSSDHGENQGELNIYGDHQTADLITCRVPFILRWPGMIEGGRVDKALHYQFDIFASILELLGAELPARWDARSFAKALKEGREEGREFLVLSQMAWSCQRAVRFENWLIIRTYHDGLKDLPPIMLFDVERDPHETQNLANERPEVVEKGLSLLERWHSEMMATSLSPVDPMQVVLREGGPFHTRAMLERYCEHLRRTGRGHHAETLMRRHGGVGRL